MSRTKATGRIKLQLSQRWLEFTQKAIYRTFLFRKPCLESLFVPERLYSYYFFNSLTCHIVEIDVIGPTSDGNGTFSVRTVRTNPCQVGAVTGNATFASFFESLKRKFIQ